MKVEVVKRNLLRTSKQLADMGAEVAYHNNEMGRLVAMMNAKCNAAILKAGELDLHGPALQQAADIRFLQSEIFGRMEMVNR